MDVRQNAVMSARQEVTMAQCRAATLNAGLLARKGAAAPVQETPALPSGTKGTIARALRLNPEHFRITYRHGLRASEVELLRRNDADLRTGRLTVHRLKGSLSGVYPMQPDIHKLLKAYLRSRQDMSPYLFVSNRQVPISRYTLWHLMQNYGEAADLPPEKRTFHILKHSIATHLLDAGAGLAFVRDWLGHANIQNTLVYARVTTVKRDAEAQRLFASPWVV
jgi:integrase